MHYTLAIVLALYLIGNLFILRFGQRMWQLWLFCFTIVPLASVTFIFFVRNKLLIYFLHLKFENFISTKPFTFFKNEKPNNNIGYKSLEPTSGVEPLTYSLRMSCSTNWAKLALKIKMSILITSTPILNFQ